MGFASTHKLPILFVCEDNDLSILTHTEVRRNWNIVDVAKAFKMEAVDIGDDPWLIAYHTRELVKNLPALINCRTCRHYWHVGGGVDGPPEWNRLVMIRQELEGLGIKYKDVEEKTKRETKRLWEKHLQIR